MKLPVNNGDDPIAVIDALKIELKRLRRVIDWACKNQGRFSNIAGATKPNSMFVEEMRRQSKE